MRRFCDPSNLPVLHAGRCIPAEHNNPAYLVLGVFKTSPEHPGFPDKRWLTLAELKAAEGLQVADIKTNDQTGRVPDCHAGRGRRRARRCARARACSGLNAAWGGLRGPEGPHGAIAMTARLLPVITSNYQ